MFVMVYWLEYYYYFSTTHCSL